jgi:hypothetical protein
VRAGVNTHSTENVEKAHLGFLKAQIILDKREGRKYNGFMQKLIINRRFFLRMLLVVYLFLFFLVSFSLSVPPSDLPLCGLMFAVAALGLVLGYRENRAWRMIWTIALIVSVLLGALEIVAGKSIARQRSKSASSSTTYFSSAARMESSCLRSMSVAVPATMCPAMLRKM